MPMHMHVRTVRRNGAIERTNVNGKKSRLSVLVRAYLENLGMLSQG